MFFLFVGLLYGPFWLPVMDKSFKIFQKLSDLYIFKPFDKINCVSRGMVKDGEWKVIIPGDD